MKILQIIAEANEVAIGCCNHKAVRQRAGRNQGVGYRRFAAGALMLCVETAPLTSNGDGDRFPVAGNRLGPLSRRANEPAKASLHFLGLPFTSHKSSLA